MFGFVILFVVLNLFRLKIPVFVIILKVLKLRTRVLVKRVIHTSLALFLYLFQLIFFMPLFVRFLNQKLRCARMFIRCLWRRFLE
jgi:hypothetical protein